MLKRVFTVLLTLATILSFSSFSVFTSAIDDTYFKAELSGDNFAVVGEKYTVYVTLGDFKADEFLGATCVVKYNSEIFEVDEAYLSIISNGVDGETYPIISREEGWVLWGQNEVLGENSSFNANILNDSAEIKSLNGSSVTFFIDFRVKETASTNEAVFKIETDENLIGVFSESSIESKYGTGSQLDVTISEEYVAQSIEIKSNSTYERKKCSITGLDIITNFSEKTTLDDFVSNFVNNSDSLKLVSGDKVYLGEEIVPTGAVLQLYVENQIVDSAIVVCKGDVDFNGVVNSTDYMQIKQYFLELFELNQVAVCASDLDENGKIDSTDYLRLKMYFLNLFNIYS